MPTYILRDKLPGGLWSVSGRNEKDELVIVFGDTIGRRRTSTSKCLTYSTWRSHGWEADSPAADRESGAALPAAAALGLPAARHGLAKLAVTGAVTAGVSLAVMAGPAVLRSPAGPAAGTPGSPGGTLRPAAAAVTGRRGGRHRKPAGGTARAAAAQAAPAPGPAPVPSPSAAPLVQVGVSAPGVAQVSVSAGTQPVQVRAGKRAVTVPPADVQAQVQVPAQIPLPGLRVCADAGLLRACAGA